MTEWLDVIIPLSVIGLFGWVLNISKKVAILETHQTHTYQTIDEMKDLLTGSIQRNDERFERLLKMMGTIEAALASRRRDDAFDARSRKRRGGR